MASSRETVNAIELQLSRARSHLLQSRELLNRVAATFTLPIHGELPLVVQVGGSQAKSDDTAPRFAAVTELIEQMNQAVTRDAALTGRLIEELALAIQTMADPFALMGMLLEGVAETVLERLPESERRDTAIALCSMLWDRINRGQAGLTGASDSE